MRSFWTAGGWVAFGVGLVGVVLPLLPTVPFMLLAAFCFARGSERFHDWLLDHPRFGPAIRDWRERGAISRPAKRLALVAIGVALLIPALLGVRVEILAVQAAVLSLVVLFILTRPNGTD